MDKVKIAKELLKLAKDLTAAETDPAKVAEIVSSLPSMSISQIAAVVSKDWRPVNYAAKPYLEAMYSLNKITDDYGQDSGKSIVIYFMGNATSWRGDVARAVKKELTKRIK